MSKSTVYTTNEYTLLNGKSVEVRPLSIKKLRKANKMLRSLGNLELTPEEQALPDVERADLEEEKYLDKLVELVAHSCDLPLGEDEDAEDVVDAETMYAIIHTATGVKLNDENLIEMAAKMAADQN